MENVNNRSDVDKTTKRETFDVNGMSCASCSNTVEKTLSRIEGVKSAEVDLAASSATVEYDPTVATPDKMQEAIESAGYRFGTKDGSENEEDGRGGC